MVLLMLVLIACADDAGLEDNWRNSSDSGDIVLGRVYGQTLARGSNAPLNEVEVKLYHRTFADTLYDTTDNEGRYAFVDLRLGRERDSVFYVMNISASHIFMESYTGQVTLSTYLDPGNDCFHNILMDHRDDL